MKQLIQTDTLTSSIQQLSERLDSLILSIQPVTAQLDTIASNTDAFKDGFSKFFTYTSLAASIVTVLGVSALFYKLLNRSISNRRQKKIILDLMRHLMVNNAILEIIFHRYDFITTKPLEGTLKRFATLEDDVNLGLLSLWARKYAKLHNISFKIRNYNSVVCLADKHMHIDGYPTDLITAELKNIFERAEDLSRKLIELSKDMGHLFPINEKKFAKYATDRYLKDDKSKKEHDISVKCNYYEKIGMKDVYDFLIDDHLNKVLPLPTTLNEGSESSMPKD